MLIMQIIIKYNINNPNNNKSDPLQLNNKNNGRFVVYISLNKQQLYNTNYIKVLYV